MFENRALSVRMVKDPGPLSSSSNPVDYDKLVRTITKSAVILIFAYMSADTARQMLINAVEVTYEQK